MTAPNLNDPGKISPPQTGQTGQKQPSYFELAEHDGKYYWCLWAGNGRLMCRCRDEGYDREKDAIQAMRNLSGAAATAKVVVKSHPKGRGE